MLQIKTNSSAPILASRQRTFVAALGQVTPYLHTRAANILRLMILVLVGLLFVLAGLMILTERVEIGGPIMGSVLLMQDFGGVVAGTPDGEDFFGFALATGDWNDDGLDDLAVGAPGDSDSGAVIGGAVNVFYGSSTGPSTTGDRMFHQNTSGIEDSAEDFDGFGTSLR